MRILVYGINFPPEPIGVGKFTGEMVEWLAEQEHEIRVVASQPYYPGWRIMPGHTGFLYSHGDWKRATIWRCPVWVPRNPSGVKRILHHLTVAISSAPVALLHAFWKPDVVFVVAPPLFCAPAALLVARLSRARSWLHVQDFEVDAAFETGLLRSPTLRRLASRIEKSLMRSFDRVSTISAKMVDGLRAKGVPSEKTLLFRNWVDVQSIYPLEGRNSFRRELGIPDGVAVALYSGNMAGKQGLDALLEAARLLQNDGSLRFVLCGDGASRKRLQQEYAGLSNVSWLPIQPLSRLNELLNLADIHVLLQIPGVADLVMPSKLTGMLASGRPVVATAASGTQVAEVVSHCGTSVPPGDVGALAATLRSLAADPEARRDLGRKAREYALKNIDLSRVLEEFERALISCCEARAR